MKYLFSLLILISLCAFADDLINETHGVALDGYDVVAYFRSADKAVDKGIKGSSKYSTDYKGVTYHFSNNENRELFLTNPESFLPEYGGWCAWAVAQGKNEVGVDYDTFIVKEDESGKKRLYLFYNSWFSNTLKKWKKKSTGTHKELVNKANKHWNEFQMN